MKPTKEQLADPKWWDEETNKDLDFCYCYWNFQLGAWFSKGPIIGKNFELLAKRPEPEWVPKVGVDCELKLGKSWVKCKADYICEQYIVVLMYGSNTYEALVRGHYEFRPIKTQREELIDIILMNSEAELDAATDTASIILGKYNLTEKDGE